MNTEIYDDVDLEKRCWDKFGIKPDVNTVILRNAPVGRSVEATLFLTAKKQLYLYVEGATKLSLGDIQKIVSRMNLKAELYFPPRGQTDYFDEIGRQKFREVFPGRGKESADDIRYYRTLALYNPALIQIAEIKNGEIYQYDSDARESWRLAKKFMYRRIKTS